MQIRPRYNEQSATSGDSFWHQLVLHKPATPMTPPDISVDEFLRGFALPLRRLAEAARRRIASVVPHATERVRSGWRLIGYNAPAYFAFISFERDHVRLGFEWGVMLTDPAGLLKGFGSQVRYIAIRSAADLEGPDVTALLRAAAAIVPQPRERRHS
jgi:hypothetical protein